VIERSLRGARVAFTTRRGGVSGGPYTSLNLGILTEDDPDSVSQNRAQVAAQIGVAPERVAMGWQVHGSDVKEWEAPPVTGRDGYAAPGAELDRVDGHATALRDLALLVLVADCLPVALATEDRVAMIHCGWRGLAAGIAERAVAGFDQPPSAVVGPGIGPRCYEVGPEVLEAFSDLDGVADGRLLDLPEVARRKLLAAGAADVEVIDRCVHCEPDNFFSHRRDAGVTGRQAGVIVRG
jgi:YfiH family protein